MIIEVDDMTEKQAKEMLKELIDYMNELDQDDFFGTEGWKHHMGYED